MPDQDRIDVEYVEAPPQTLEQAKARLARIQAQRRAELENVRAVFSVREELERAWEQRGLIETPEATPDGETTVLGEVGRAAWGAVVDAVGETAIFLKDASRALLPLHKIGLGPSDAENEQFNEFLRDKMRELAPENETVAGGIARSIAQFLIPYAGWARGAKALNLLQGSRKARGLLLGALTDMSAFDPDDGNLSALLREHAELRDPVTEFLATDPDDSAAVNRLRNALEGVVLGELVEGFIYVLKGMRLNRALKDLNEAQEQVAREGSHFEFGESAKPEAPKADVAEPAPLPPLERKPVDLVLEWDEIGRFYKVNEEATLAKLPPVPEGHTRMYRAESPTVKHSDVFDEEGVRATIHPHLEQRPGQFYTPSLEHANSYREAYNQNGDATIYYVDVPNDKLGDEVVQREYIIDIDGINAERAAMRSAEAPKADAAGDASAAPKADAATESTTRIRDTLRNHLKFPPEVREQLVKAIEAEDFSKARGLIDFNADTIDWDALDEGDSIRVLLNTFSEIIADTVDDQIKGGVQTLVETQRLAKLVGTSAEQAHRLFIDVRSQRGLTARMLAAEKTLLASADRLRVLARRVKETGSHQDRLALHRHIELHAALQAEVKGSKKEIARALHAMRTMKAASEQSFKEFDEIRRYYGGHKDADAIVDAILQTRSPEELSAFVQKTVGRRISDVISEIVINGLLSATKTQVINLVSNAVNTVIGSADRYVVALGKSMTPGARAAWHEANAELIGKIFAMRDALRLASRAFVEGRPITDMKQRLEFDTRTAIRVDTSNLVGWKYTLGTAVNVIGHAIRLPGRILMTGDEFFKVINKRGEIAALAYRQAAEEADLKNLTGDAWKEYVVRRAADLIEAPTPEMEIAALKRARYATFQEAPRTALGEATERFLNANPYVKLIVAPFVRTPLNILRQVFVDRSPLAMLMPDTWRVIREGGPEAEAAIARMVMGTAAITAGAMLVAGGGPDKPYEIVGKLPLEDPRRNLFGLQDYSIRVGDTWFQFSRLDPIGSWLGLSADIDTYMRSNYDPDDPQSATHLFALFQASLAAVWNNALSKSWTQSLQDLLDNIEQVRDGSPHSAKRAIERMLADQTWKLVPYSSAIRTLATSGIVGVDEGDPLVREAWSFVERLQKNVPGLSRDLPPMRDYLGREVTRHNADLFWINPFASAPDSDDPLERELARVGLAIPRLNKSLGNGKIPLNAEQYSEFKRLIGQEPLYRNGPTLEEELRRLIASRYYQQLPSDFRRVEEIKRRYEAAKRVAQEKLMDKYPELRQRAREIDRLEYRRMTGRELPF